MNNLKKARQLEQWSQAAMAKYLQVTKSQVSMVECGKRTLPKYAAQTLSLLMMQQEGLEKNGRPLINSPAKTAEIHKLLSAQAEEACSKLKNHIATCKSKRKAVTTKLETAVRHYQKAMATLISVEASRHTEIPPSDTQVILLNRLEAEANIKLLRFPLHDQKILKIRIAGCKSEETTAARDIVELMQLINVTSGNITTITTQ